jgi:hypothetical protein
MTAIVDTVLGDLIDALNDNLAHEVSRSPEVKGQVRAGIRALNDRRYDGYLESWWLLGEGADDGSSGGAA